MTDCPRGDLPYENSRPGQTSWRSSRPGRGQSPPNASEEISVSALRAPVPTRPRSPSSPGHSSPIGSLREERRPAVQESIDPRYAELVAAWNRAQMPSRDGVRPVRGFVVPSPRR